MPNRQRTSRTKPTQMSGVQNQIRQLRLETATGITIRPAASDPPALTNNGRWIPRKVYIAGASAASSLSIGSISTALKTSNNIGATGDFYILKISLWGAYGASLDNAVSANVEVGNLTTSGRAAGGSDQVFARDIGTGTRRPGFSIHVPRTDALLSNFDTAGATTVMNSVSNAIEYHITVLQLI
jgi:hypothetical protein